MTLRVLTVSSLYPNSVQFRNGIFVRERLHKWMNAWDIRPTVIAPVPWFPFKNPVFGSYARFAQIPLAETDADFEVFHPRYVVIPKIGSAVSPLTYYWSVRRILRKSVRENFHLIDAHFAFPDGAAAVLLARKLNLPVCITVRGSDLNFIADEFVAGRWIRWALQHCDAIIAVSNELGEKAAEIIGDDSKVHVLPNGVDRGKFRALAASETLRAELNVGTKVLLSIGNLISLKGHHLVIDALRYIPDASLIIVGKGPMERCLKTRAEELGVMGRVRFQGEVPQAELVDYYNLADVLVLASSSEGMPNVVLESLACGTPVVATGVGGIKEVLTQPVQGRLIAERTSEAIKSAIEEVLSGRLAPAVVVSESVASFDWNRTTSGLQKLSLALCGQDHVLRV